MRAPLAHVALPLFAAAISACASSAPPDESSANARAAPVDVRSDEGTPTPSQIVGATSPIQASLPRVISAGGPVLASPRFAAITFAGDPLAADLETFVAGFGATDHWRAVAEEYGVDRGVATDPLRLGETAPAQIGDDTIEAWLATQLDGTHPGWATPDGSTVYVVFYPKATTITHGGRQSCRSFGGFHGETRLATGVDVPYVVVPRCATYQGLSGIDMVTAAASHELVEAATDPFPWSNPAFQRTDRDHAAWPLIFGGAEVGDMCPPTMAPFYRPSGFPFLVQRSWSNAAAEARKDPCVPAEGPSFQSVAVADDMLKVVVDRNVIGLLGVKIPVGQKKTIPVVLFGDGPPESTWTVSAEDDSAYYGGPPALAFSFDRSEGRSGDALELTITVLATETYDLSGFVITSTRDGRRSLSAGLVGP